MQNEIEIVNFTPEKSKQVALARLDLIYEWKEYQMRLNQYKL